MESQTSTTETQVEEPHRGTLQSEQKDVLEKLPGVKKKKKKMVKISQPDRKQVHFNKGDEVLFTAFLKSNKNEFYMCKGIIEQTPQETQKNNFKVRVIAVADAPVGGEQVVKQAQLLGRTITKKYNELFKEVAEFMKPKAWIQIVSDK